MSTMQRPVLVGEFDFTLDAKNRVAVPARLRTAFVDGIYVTQENERCSTLKSKVRALERFAAAGAVHQELDRQGRITLPARHLQFAAIDRETTVIGVRDHIEIWDRAAWAAYLAHLEEEADATADELATP